MKGRVVAATERGIRPESGKADLGLGDGNAESLRGVVQVGFLDTQDEVVEGDRDFNLRRGLSLIADAIRHRDLLRMREAGRKQQGQ